MNRPLTTVFAMAAAALAASCAASTMDEAETSAVSAPNVQTQPPVIHLADNLGEPDQLGWCVDTVGRGESDQLHAHTCKPSEGDDVRFSYDPALAQIRSASYENQCAEYSAPENETIPFGLLDCDPDNIAQQFDYVAESQEIQYRGDPSLCMTVAEAINPAGPFVSRSLLIQPCAEVEASHKQWQILAE